MKKVTYYSDTKDVERVLIQLVLFAALSTFWADHAVAQEKGSHLGVLYGYGVPDADNSNPHRMFGVRGTANLSPTFSIGGYYYVAGQDEGTGGQDFDFSLHGLEAALQIPGGEGATFVAFRAGIAKVRTDMFGPSVIFSPYHYGFASGYNYSLTSWFAVGFEGSFLYAEQSTTSLAGTSYELQSFSVLSFLASIQFRL